MFTQFHGLIPYRPIGGGVARLLEEMLESAPAAAPATAPKVNAWEDDDGYAVEVEVPGLTHDEVQVSFEDDTLTVAGSWSSESEQGGGVRRRERATGSFRRQFTFRNPVQVDKTEATLKDGVLTIRLPKEPEAKPRSIQVKRG